MPSPHFYELLQIQMVQMTKKSYNSNVLIVFRGKILDKEEMDGPESQNSNPGRY